MKKIVATITFTAIALAGLSGCGRKKECKPCNKKADQRVQYEEPAETKKSIKADYGKEDYAL